MKFQEAIKEMKEGKKVRRNSWRKGIYLYMGNYRGEIYLFGAEEHDEFWSAFMDDYQAENWEVVEEIKKPKVNVAFKEGYDMGNRHAVTTMLEEINKKDKGDFWEWCRNNKNFDYCDKTKHPIDFIIAFEQYLKKRIIGTSENAPNQNHEEEKLEKIRKENIELIELCAVPFTERTEEQSERIYELIGLDSEKRRKAK